MANELLSMAQQFSGLDMGSLIGGPLMAAANANQSMALTQTKFMLDTCFTKTGSADTKDLNYSPIMIQMTLTRGVISQGPADPATGKTPDPVIQQFDTKFNLPLLTIIPLNSLAVDTVNITFDMEVKSSASEDHSEEHTKELKAQVDFEAKFKAGCFSVSVKGSVSVDNKDVSSDKSHYEKSNSAKYHVDVHASQLPLPKGVTTIIDAFSKAIEPITIQPQTK